MRMLTHASAMAVKEFLRFYAEKAGKIITRDFTGFIKKRNCTYAPKNQEEVNQQKTE